MHGIDKTCINIAKGIASHPLILANLIVNPITNESVPISSYRTYGGLETTSGTLTCAVYPAPVTTLTAKTPSAQAASIVYKPYNLGSETDEIITNIHISFYYNSVTSGSQSTPLILENMPTQLPINNDEIVIENSTNIELYTDVALHILSQCIELLRLIIYDIKIDDLNTKVELLTSSFIGGQWEKDPYFKEVMTSCLVTTHLPKAAKHNQTIQDIKYNINNENS
jgi:hypothetical protein